MDRELKHELGRLRWRLDFLIMEQHLQEVRMANVLDALVAQVTETLTVEQSALVLIQGIADRISAAAADPVLVASLAAQLHASAAALSDAVVANTPPTP